MSSLTLSGFIIKLAFDFVSQLLKKTYTHLNFDLMGAHGEGGMHHIISYINTDFLILIYDKSNNIKMLQNINTEIREFKNRNSNARVISIMPKVFEEILLSYIYLQDLIKTTDKQGIALMNIIKEYVTGKVGVIILQLFDISLQEVQSFSQQLEILDGLCVQEYCVFTYTDSSMSSKEYLLDVEAEFDIDELYRQPCIWMIYQQAFSKRWRA